MKNLDLDSVLKNIEATKGDTYRRYCNCFIPDGCYYWCASYISVIMRENGLNYPWSTSCNSQIKSLKQGNFDYTYLGKQFGKLQLFDVVYYEFEEPVDADHVGICIGINGSTATILEGNKMVGMGSEPNQTRVSTRVISIYDSSMIYGVARLKSDVGNSNISEEVEEFKETYVDIVSPTKVDLPTIRKYSRGSVVKILQMILSCMGYEVGTCGIDGDFGHDTEEAVKTYQQDKKIEVDGIVGHETWTSIFRGD